MSEEAVTRKEVYEILYNNLSRIQDFYRSFSIQCSQQLWQAELSDLPFDENEEKYREDLENAAYTSESQTRNLEMIKYKMSLAVLSEGVLIEEQDLTETINEIDKILYKAEEETSTKNKHLKKWTNTKIKYLNDTRHILLQILEHKLAIKVNLGKVIRQ